MSGGPARGAEEEVAAAAAELIGAYAASDHARYFDCFTPDATFLFHDEPGLLTTAAYEAQWMQSESEGFRVESCESSDGCVQALGPDAAVFTHRVLTRLAGSAEPIRERETIVFTRRDGRWLAAHEHLSLDPAGNGGAGTTSGAAER